MVAGLIAVGGVAAGMIAVEAGVAVKIAADVAVKIAAEVVADVVGHVHVEAWPPRPTSARRN